MPSILIVDDERSIRTMLSDYLADRYEVVCAENGAEALDLLAKRKIDLVISDISMPEMNGIELLCAVRERHPSVKCALLTGNNIDHFIKSDTMEYIGNIIPKTAPFNFAEFESIARGLITGDIFGLKRYLLEDGTILAQFKITSSDDGRSVRKQALAVFTERFGSAGDMELVLDEIITNAVYHAPSKFDGADKYPSYSTVTLKPGEFVSVECGCDREKYGVSITDRKGRLKKETVLRKMERQINGAGLLDESGRGIHMSRLFADRMIINIDPGRKTEVILMNYLSPTYRGFKPLYINEL
jgi:CheY-like chemotaxis protein/anti-sigma regulatory factor (Ser/Thr protein kinase)